MIFTCKRIAQKEGKKRSMDLVVMYVPLCHAPEFVRNEVVGFPGENKSSFPQEITIYRIGSLCSRLNVLRP